MTIFERVTLRVGKYYSPLRTQELMDEAVRLTMGDLPSEVLYRFASEYTDSGSGVSVADKRVLDVHKAGYRATQLPASYRDLVVEESNTFEADEYSPAYYVLGDTLFVLPDGGIVVGVSYPTVTITSSTVSGIPQQIVDLFIERCAMLVLDRLMVEQRDASTLSVTLPTAPSAPAAPAFSYSDATSVAPSATSIAALPSAPSYSAPSLQARPTPPTVSSIDLSKKVDGSTSLPLPSAPAAPALAYSDAAADTVGTVTVGAVPTVPTYNAPSFSGSLSLPVLPSLSYTNKVDGTTALVIPSAPAAPDVTFTDATLGTWTAAASIGSLPAPPSLVAASFAGNIAAITSAIPAAIDLTKELDGATAIDPPTPPAAPTLATAGLSATTIGSLGTPPAYTKTGTTLSYSNYTTYESAEDPEMMGAILSKLATELQDLRASREDEWQEFQKEAEIYRSTVQSAIEQARITLQERLQTLQQTDQMALQDYVQGLAQYDRDLARYNAEIERVALQARTNLERAVSGVAEAQRLYLRQYEVLSQEAIAAFQGAVQDHLKECDRVLGQAQLDQQRLSEMFRASTDLSIQNEIQTAQTLLADYERDIARYRAQVEQYQVDVTLVNQKWELDYRKAFEPWQAQQALYLQKYQADIASESDRFRGQMEDHQLEVQRLLAQAQIDQQRVSQQAQLTTDVALQNELQTLQAAVADWQADLGRYSAELQQYQLDVEAVLRKYTEKLDRELALFSAEGTLDVNRYQALVANAQSAFQADLAAYQAAVERNALAAQIARQEAEQTARQATEVAVQNKARKLEADIALYQSTLQKHQQDVASYAHQVEAAVAKVRTDNEAIQARIKMLVFDRQRIEATYRQILSSFLRMYWPFHSYTVRQPVI